MIAIDCGNTRLKWARFEGRRRVAAGNVGVRGNADAWAELAGALTDADRPVLVANVAGGEVADRIAAAVVASTGKSPELVAVETHAYGIECAYAEPESLGVDRWLSMIAGRDLVAGPFVVVGAGTALTIDAVDADGMHLGGLIMPGDGLMIEALATHAKQIPVVPRAGGIRTGLELLGRSTAEAVGRGGRLALAAAVDRAVATVAAALGGPIQLLLTGGDAAALNDWLESEAQVKADLVLEGLAVVGEGRE